MIFTGGSMLMGTAGSVPLCPTHIDDIRTITLKNGKFDDFYVSRNTSYPLTPYIDQGWTNDTIMWAKFDGNTAAGNVEWTAEMVKFLLVKRKKENEYKWITLEVHEVTSIDDFNFYGTDIAAQPLYSYEYAVVPIIDNLEGAYVTAECDVKLSNTLMIADFESCYITPFSNAYLDTVSQVPPSTFNTMNNFYPTFIKNTNADYEQVTVDADFLPGDACEINIDNDKENYAYRKEVLRFLRRNNIKILKSEDSRMWIGLVSSSVTDSANNYYKVRKISFQFTEIAEIDDEKTLYNGSFITAPSKWWNVNDDCNFSKRNNTDYLENIATGSNYQNGYNAALIASETKISTSSASYAAGYNLGVSDADNRVLTSSASYTAGYNSGLLFASNNTQTICFSSQFVQLGNGQTTTFSTNYTAPSDGVIYIALSSTRNVSGVNAATVRYVKKNGTSQTINETTANDWGFCGYSTFKVNSGDVINAYISIAGSGTGLSSASLFGFFS